MIGHMSPWRRSADPFEDIVRPAGPASRRAQRLTRGRMRPPPDLVAQATEERRRQVARFLAAVSASPSARGTRATPHGPVPMEVHVSPLGFWLVDDSGVLVPDPAGRAGLSTSGLGSLISQGEVNLDASDPRTRVLLQLISGEAGA